MNQTERARLLRRNMTDAEQRIWQALRNRALAGLKFRRQVPVGPYIVDFQCRDRQLVVEIDGGQHDEMEDAERTAFLRAQGYRVIRFWNHEVLENLDGVLERIAGVAGPSSNSG
ncbi:MAG: endonuclease domain-containing protein [Sphingomonadales bacterium]|nr:endonuclease domain-containing protein [Sphingomonadales bacterium]MBD3772811.1 endonuclease domain-containing protein [Paracoccaceae bacterium]